jgi:mono/diheme cytochrome c family protein
MRRRLVTGFLATVALFTSYGSFAQQRGSEVYAIRCATCHGPDGAGTANALKTFGSVPDLRRPATQSKSDIQLFESIAHGVDHKQYAHLYLYAGVTREEIGEIVTHLRRFAKK